MTAEELIQLLQTLPPQQQVYAQSHVKASTNPTTIMRIYLEYSAVPPHNITVHDPKEGL